MRTKLAKYLIAWAERLLPQGVHFTVAPIAVEDEEDVMQFLQLPVPTDTVPPVRSYYVPTRLECEMAEVVSRHGVSLLVVQQQACACVHRIGTC